MQYGKRMDGHLLSTILMDKDNRESPFGKYFFGRGGCGGGAGAGRELAGGIKSGFPARGLAGGSGGEDA